MTTNPVQSNEDQEFFDQMDSDANAVYVVEAYGKLDRERLGVFSTKDKASAWCRTFPDEWQCIISSFIINEPDFGNVKSS